MTLELKTERLVLRPMQADDAAAMQVMNADPEVMRYIGRGVPLSLEETEARTAKAAAHWDAHGWGVFAAVERDTGTLVGWAALATPSFLPEILPVTELGWRMRSDRWGRGYAPEAARAAMGFAFGELGLDRVVSCIHSENTASIRVAEKLGMRLERVTLIPGYEVPCSVYERRAGL
ncbi:GNAT family N-acetyltransferase [Glycomyces algeriensis]|uniref:N-acetyltransferase n=1 Tax=Glycomyces algeriensis TaxID=256037 RepID=A0A9W6G7Z5_9ACTN|nr:GNAT family N-acetyltransferase [Glycomyces algeriensis]MDA1365946.1 GNAT family N-acetyltransferase [Glycomyces algeriensis]MDR7349287.1 RimJ/RimL family protein N-acetyltransferase [Glycomyces algeriensis]GLI41987.1 N-acetyltransferase [Glycomyces algeriensis]